VGWLRVDLIASRLFFFFWKYSGEHQQSYQITAASVLFYHQSSNRAISVVDGGGIADNCGEFIHFHYISSWNFA